MEHRTRAVLLEKLPLLALSLAWGAIAIYAQRAHEAMASFERFPLDQRIGNALLAYVGYLRKTVLPDDLAVFYPHPGNTLGLATVVAAALVLLASAAVFWALHSRRPALLAGWLIFLAALLPVIGLVQTGAQAMADRYMYVPLLGLLLIGVWSMPPARRDTPFKTLPALLGVVFALVALSATTARQIGYWKSGEELFRRALEVTAGNYVAHVNLGNALVATGKISEARGHYQEAIRISPGVAEAHNGLGNVLFRSGKFEAALVEYSIASSIAPDSGEFAFNVGLALLQLGRHDEATRFLERAAAGMPGSVAPLAALASALAASGRSGEARALLEEALNANPQNFEARLQFANLLARTGNPKRAVEEYRTLLGARPASAGVHLNLGVALEMQGDRAEAARHYREALRLDPRNANAHNNLGGVLADLGQLDDAAAQYREALRLDPGSRLARTNLDRLADLKRQASP
jgi:tetratricopeptide (TPR) repeat protein